ncbi:MAG: hypothetical protein HY291_01720, partial [Planctomycetes bacterium]|nr:hypothetical protein [Planctomycetota bacterium]
YGGELVNEYKTLAKYFRIILEFDRQGMMRRVPDEKVNEAQAIIEKTVDYKSDDPHILALAQVSKVRLLLTDDDDLTTDFTNKDVISPKGNVYKNKAHAPLIRKHCEC